MSLERTQEGIRRLAIRPQRRIGLASGLIMAGLMVEMAVLGIGAWLGVSAGEYWGATKASRDTAAVGSGLLVDIGTISAVTAWLTPLKFVGLALFFAGIATVLSAIIPRIELRANALATVLPALKQRH